jgi:hypothetical protein
MKTEPGKGVPERTPVTDKVEVCDPAHPFVCGTAPPTDTMPEPVYDPAHPLIGGDRPSD